jgi:glycosyltransferase involved in cell wall biosynthesis
MITYGHEKYIEEAIKSVLMQQYDFEIELILSNDCSPDSTDVIIQNIINTHPKAHLIHYTKHQKNIGMMPNFIFALKQCKGKYIALCEGDDYWTDPMKLQKQIEFLEKNDDFVLTFHNALIHNNFTNTKYPFLENYNIDEFEVSHIFERWIIPTASMVFKNNLTSDFPDFFTYATHGDLALQMYLSKFGKFKGFDDILSVYRINQSSVTANSFSSFTQNNKHVIQLHLMDDYFEKKYTKQIRKRIFLFYLLNAKTFKYKSIGSTIYWIFKAISLNPLHLLDYKSIISELMTNILKTAKYKIKEKLTPIQSL